MFLQPLAGVRRAVLLVLQNRLDYLSLLWDRPAVSIGLAHLVAAGSTIWPLEAVLAFFSPSVK
jgi:hypothetical protein